MTLHELLGRLAAGWHWKLRMADGDLKKAYNLEGVTHVHFEETYLYPVHQVGWMADFILRQPSITFSMTGDPG